ncbi:MAG: 16S rRNA (cytosine(1402)-N(4))-methyltransferase RsmH [bacterium]|nr:16S rRNA (cytosine(1402)-N(4))-methyltransferase RsmH [bacterium]
MHIPVLLKEVLRYLDPKPGENFIDCTIGQGGHAFAILERIAPGGRVLGIDADSQSLRILALEQKAKNESGRLVLAEGNFMDVGSIAEKKKFVEVQGVLMDLGWSSWQMEESGRGFSFLKDEMLDMRMSSVQTLTAEHIVNTYTEKTLAEIFEKFGEERFAKKIAKAIIEKRRLRKILRTKELAEIVIGAIPSRFHHGRIHVSTRVFQALRIATNDELESLNKALRGAYEILSPGGRLAVISFHSLEDRIVKNFFREEERAGRLTILTKKPVMSSGEETAKNPRSRSAKLRAAVKTMQNTNLKMKN